MSYRSRHQWFRRTALGLTLAAVTFAGPAAAQFDEGDDGDAIAIRNAIERESALSSGELAWVDAVVAAADSLHDPLTEEQDLRSGEGSESDGQFRLEHARDARAQGGLSGFLIEVAEALLAEEPEAP